MKRLTDSHVWRTMRSSTLRRLAAITISMAVAGAALAAPASADPQEATWQNGLDLKPGSVFSDLSDSTVRMIIHNACGATTPYVTASDLDDVAYASSGSEAESLLISATVDLDGVDGFDTTCTFGVIETDITGPYAAQLTGSYRLVVSSPVDVTATVEQPVAPSFSTYTRPIFTDVDEYATASLTSTGSRVEQRPGKVSVPGVPKTASQIDRAKLSRAKYTKMAKKTYAKAKKRATAIKSKSKKKRAKAKAVVAYRKRLKIIERSYQQTVSTPPAKMKPGLIPVAAAYSVTSVLGEDAP